EGVRREVAQALGRLGTTEGIPVLIDLLKDADESVCDAATTSLQTMGNPAVMPLVAVMRDVPVRVQKKIVQTLGAVGDLRAVNPLLDLLENAVPEVRALVADAVVQIDALSSGPETVHYTMK